MFRASAAFLALTLVSSTVFTPPAVAKPMGKDYQKEAGAPGINYWWPNRLNLEPLRNHNTDPDPRDPGFDYKEAFQELDTEQLLTDLKELMKTSQDWWPADFGHYGPFFIRMSWHSAGTYRTIDGRGGADGGMQRFAPLNSWPDNANLDKAQRLLWPIKEKYGDALSWSDLIVLAGTVAMDDMGFETLGFAFGREDAWQPEDVYWGPEGEWLGSDRFNDGELERPLGATQMGLIYVNPEGPGGVPDPQAAADRIRETFGRMAMNDRETVALIAGGHTFGKAHGAAKPADCVEAEPEAAPMEQQGLGWKNKCGTGKGADTITSGLEGAWTVSPAQWTHNYLQNLFNLTWEKTKSPGGATQWVPKEEHAQQMVPDAHDPDKFHAPIMFTTDIALKVDPEYRKIAKEFLENPETFEQAYAEAWFKLTHRDMGPRSRYLGDMVPDEKFIWQDPVPEVDHKLVNENAVTDIKKSVLESGLTVPELIRAAWASASSFRQTDMRGGANGARVRLEPQVNWEANNPDELKRVLAELTQIRDRYNKTNRGGMKISMADMIVLGGAAALEKAASDAGYDIDVPFEPGRTDATQEMTDAASFSVLEKSADGFRNYFAEGSNRSPAEMLVEKAALLGLTVPEMTVLVGGMRTLDANYDGSEHGVFTDAPGTLSNDFFVNLVDMSTEWKKSDEPGIYEGYERDTDNRKWTATPVDLIFGANSELRAVAELYAQDDADERFVQDFVDAWVKVMNLDRF